MKKSIFITLLLLLLLVPAAQAAPTRSEMDAHAAYKLGGRMVNIGDTIYYAQADGIYVMATDGTLRERIHKATDPSLLQYRDGYLYFRTDENQDNIYTVVRLDTDSKKTKNIVDADFGGFLIGGDVLYYSDKKGALRSLHLKNNEKRLIKDSYAGMYGITFEGYFGDRLYIASADSDDDSYIDIYSYSEKILQEHIPFNGAYFSAHGDLIYLQREKGLYSFSVSTINGKLSGGKLVQAFTREQADIVFLSGKDMYFILYSEDGLTLTRRAIKSGKPKEFYARQADYDTYVEVAPCAASIWVFENGKLVDSIEK